MRLTSSQRDAIKESVRLHLPDARIYLYGSRTDDTKRGGDIDLLVLTNQSADGAMKSLILREMFKRIGERHIDLLVEREGHLGHFANCVMDGALAL